MQNRMKNHQLNNEQIEEILIKSPVGNMATINKDGFPYVLPMHFAYYDAKIYLHGLPKGKKIDNILANEKVSFGIYDMKGLILDKEPCDTNTVYESIVITGTAKLVADPLLKQKALNKIVEKYTPNFTGSKLPDNMIHGAAVIEISIIRCTGKYYK